MNAVLLIFLILIGLGGGVGLVALYSLAYDAVWQKEQKSKQ